MEIKNKTFLILGAGGLTGSYIAQELLKSEEPKKIILSSLKNERESKKINKLLKYQQCDVYWGNIFVNEKLKNKSLNEIKNNQKNRNIFLADTIECKYKNNFLFKIIKKEKPDIIIDCINTATVLAYQNIFKTREDIYNKIKTDEKINGDSMEKILTLESIPLLL